MEQTAIIEFPVGTETPKITTTITLPEIGSFGQNSLRLGMHTDSINTLLRALYVNPLARQIRIEGRILTPDQEQALRSSRTYRFYMSTRVSRGGLLVASDLGLSNAEISGLTTTGFSPGSLQSELGFETGFYDASSFIAKFLAGRPNDLLGIIGGVNTFRIGTDTLTQEQLAQVAERLNEAFQEQEEYGNQFRQAATPRLTPGFNNIPYSSIFQSNQITISIKPDSLKINNPEIPFEKLNFRENIKTFDKF